MYFGYWINEWAYSNYIVSAQWLLYHAGNVSALKLLDK